MPRCVHPGARGFDRQAQQLGIEPARGLLPSREQLLHLAGNVLIFGGQDVFTAYAVDPRHGGARRIRAFVTPAALSRDGRFVIGGDNTEESYDARSSDVVRVPWNGGRARVLLRRAASPSFNG